MWNLINYATRPDTLLKVVSGTRLAYTFLMVALLIIYFGGTSLLVFYLKKISIA
jgi:hypothetical protein